MRLATILQDGRTRVGVIDGDRITLADPGVTIRALAAGPVPVDLAVGGMSLPLDAVTFAPAVPDPGAIYAIGLNYDGPGAAPRPDRPFVFGKAASSVAGQDGTLAWDRSVTDDVDAEAELGVVMGSGGSVFGYTCIDDVSARDANLSGDQWLIGKSMPGYCPVGPWVVTADAFDPTDVRLTCSIDGQPIQDGRTSQMRFSIPEIVAYLGRHLELRPGDLIATGTPVRLTTPPGPTRRLRPGDTVTVEIEGIGRLTTHIA